MNATQGHTLPPDLTTELRMHLRTSGSTLTVAQAAIAAIRAWIAASTPQPPPASPPDSAHSLGYQWKTLFLPSGTELRMSTGESTYHARVVGDDIIFKGRSVSPRGITLAVAGNARNAWRDVWLKMPGQTGFKPASRCRREHVRVATGLPANPAAQLWQSMINQRNAQVVADLPASVPVDENDGEPASGPASAPASVPASASSAQHADQAATATATVAAAAIAVSEALKTMLASMERLNAGAMPDEDRRINPARREDDILADHCAFD